MILSHRHRFIFIKTTKSAGTSVEIALRPHCGPDDVIARLGAAKEANLAVHPQNYLAPFAQYDLRDWYLLLRRGIKKQRFSSHMSAADIQERVDPDVWANYYKFCVVRNPWDRVISMYYHRAHRARNDWPSIDAMLDDPLALEDLVRRSEGLYTIDGEVAVDRVVRYESMEEQLAEVFAHLCITVDQLPRANASARKDKRHFREVLTPDQQERISAIFRSEIERMGYDRATL